MLASMMDAETHDDLLALLAWWQEAGVDMALAETAIDWTARTAAPGADFAWPAARKADHKAQAAPRLPAPAAMPPSEARPPEPRRPEVRRPTPLPQAAPQPAARTVPSTQAAPAPSRAFPATPPDAASMAAREAARKAPDLTALETALKGFDGCGLKATAKNLCFYRGSPTARLMIVGEAPGSDEDRAGKPFVGRSGQLLDKMLAAIGLTEADVHITNTVYWRPPGNRTPTPQETLVCRPFLDRQIELVAPDVILTLGGPATAAILGATDGILKVRGKWREVTAGGAKVRVMPSLHPAYLLRTPAAKRQAWRDLLAIKMALAETDK